MKVTLTILVTLVGLAAGVLAEEKAPAKKQAQYNPKELGVDKAKGEQRKEAKWEGPEYDAAKGQRKTKQKTKGQK